MCGAKRGGLFSWLLNYNQEVIFIRCDHNFIFLGADLKEGELIVGVTFTCDELNLQDEVVHEGGILCSGGIVYGALNGNAFCVHPNDSLCSLLALRMLQCLLYSAISDGWVSSARV